MNKTFLLIYLLIGIVAILVLIAVLQPQGKPADQSPLPVIHASIAPSTRPILPITSPSQIATPTPSASPQALTGITKEQFIAILPIIQTTFNIEYIPSYDYFRVTITESPYEKNKTLAQQWLKSQGVLDLNAFDIQYAAYRYVQ